MRQRTDICLHYRKPGDLGLALLVAILSLSLVWMGGLVWIGNDVALIPDNDPRTNCSLEEMAELASTDQPAQFNQAGRASGSGGGAMLVRGNGDRDDNREEYFALKRTATAWVELKPGLAPGNFKQRRTAVSYKDLGHLKIMSAEGGNSDIFTSVFIHKEGHPCIMGGLYFC